MALLKCVTKVGQEEIQWTCTLKENFDIVLQQKIPSLVVTMGEENDIPEFFKQINLFDLFKEEIELFITTPRR